MNQTLSIASYLAIKEIWRNRGRFLLVSLVIALITLLVLFIAALGEGLGNGNREYISKLDGQLIVYQAKSDFLIPASRISLDRLAELKQVDGVADAGMLGTANATLVLDTLEKPLKVALLGVDPGHVGEPKVVQGTQLATDTADEVIIDRSTALRSKLKVGDTLTLRVTQGTEDQFFDLKVVGISDGQQYSLQPSLFVPFNNWDRIRPKSEAEVKNPNPVPNVMLVKLENPEAIAEVSAAITSQVKNVDVATLKRLSQRCRDTPPSKAL